MAARPEKRSTFFRARCIPPPRPQTTTLGRRHCQGRRLGTRPRPLRATSSRLAARRRSSSWRTSAAARAGSQAKVGPFSHATGAGWMRPRPGCYRDAIVVKRHKLRLLIADPHGGVTRSTHMWLRSLSKRARVGRDATVYGAHLPRVSATHHGACKCHMRVCAARGRCVPEGPQRP